MKIKIPIYAAFVAFMLGTVPVLSYAQESGVAEPGGRAGKWAKRTPVKPDPSKIKVPPGYKVGVFASGLDTVTSITVDGALKLTAADGRNIHVSFSSTPLADAMGNFDGFVGGTSVAATVNFNAVTGELDEVKV